MSPVTAVPTDIETIVDVFIVNPVGMQVPQVGPSRSQRQR